MSNNIFSTDSYNSSDFLQIPPNTKFQSSYQECRNKDFKDVVFFGPQIEYKQKLCKKTTLKDIEKLDRRLRLMGDLDWPKEDFKRMVNKYGGYYPIEIKSVDEGMVIPTGNVFWQVQNVESGFMPYLNTWIESASLKSMWYPSIVATLCRNLKMSIRDYMEISCDDLSNLDYMLHNFGDRAGTSDESSVRSGAGFAVMFRGTDVIQCLDVIEDCYSDPNAAGSVNAMKHATIGAWGKHREKEAYENFIDKFLKPGRTIAIPTDNYNHWNAVENIIGVELKDKIVNSGGTLVVRIDSGEAIGSVIKTIKILMDKFGFRMNRKGYKVLPNCIRVLKSDVRKTNHMFDTFDVMHNDKFSIDNLATFGVGGELVQKVARDMIGGIQKSSAIAFDCEDIIGDLVWYDCHKDPIDAPFKRSKTGIQSLIIEDNQYKTIRKTALKNWEKDRLTTAFKCGELIKDHTFQEIRFNSAI